MISKEQIETYIASKDDIDAANKKAFLDRITDESKATFTIAELLEISSFMNIDLEEEELQALEQSTVTAADGTSLEAIAPTTLKGILRVEFSDTAVTITPVIGQFSQSGLSFSQSDNKAVQNAFAAAKRNMLKRFIDLYKDNDELKAILGDDYSLSLTANGTLKVTPPPNTIEKQKAFANLYQAYRNSPDNISQMNADANKDIKSYNDDNKKRFSISLSFKMDTRSFDKMFKQAPASSAAATATAELTPGPAPTSPSPSALLSAESDDMEAALEGEDPDDDSESTFSFDTAASPRSRAESVDDAELRRATTAHAMATQAQRARTQSLPELPKPDVGDLSSPADRLSAALDRQRQVAQGATVSADHRQAVERCHARFTQLQRLCKEDAPGEPQLSQAKTALLASITAAGFVNAEVKAQAAGILTQPIDSAELLTAATDLAESLATLAQEAGLSMTEQLDRALHDPAKIERKDLQQLQSALTSYLESKDIKTDFEELNDIKVMLKAHQDQWPEGINPFCKPVLDKMYEEIDSKCSPPSRKGP